MKLFSIFVASATSFSTVTTAAPGGVAAPVQQADKAIENIGYPPLIHREVCYQYCHPEFSKCLARYCRGGPICTSWCRESICRVKKDCVFCSNWGDCLRNNGAQACAGIDGSGPAVDNALDARDNTTPSTISTPTSTPTSMPTVTPKPSMMTVSLPLTSTTRARYGYPWCNTRCYPLYNERITEMCGWEEPCPPHTACHNRQVLLNECTLWCKEYVCSIRRVDGCQRCPDFEKCHRLVHYDDPYGAGDAALPTPLEIAAGHEPTIAARAASATPTYSYPTAELFSDLYNLRASTVSDEPYPTGPTPTGGDPEPYPTGLTPTDGNDEQTPTGVFAPRQRQTRIPPPPQNTHCREFCAPKFMECLARHCHTRGYCNAVCREWVCHASPACVQCLGYNGCLDNNKPKPDALAERDEADTKPIEQGDNGVEKKLLPRPPPPPPVINFAHLCGRYCKPKLEECMGHYCRGDYCVPVCRELVCRLDRWCVMCPNWARCLNTEPGAQAQIERENAEKLFTSVYEPTDVPKQDDKAVENQN